MALVSGLQARFSGLLSGLNASAGGGGSSVSVGLLESGSSTANLDTTVTGSISPGGNRLVICDVFISNLFASLETPTLTGNGLTWVLVDTSGDAVDGANGWRLCRYRAMGASPSAGAVTITTAVAHRGLIWSISEFSNVDTSGTNGSGAIGTRDTARSSDAAQTTLNIDITTLTSGASLFVASATGGSNLAITSDSDFTQLSDAGMNSPTGRMATEHASDQTTCDPTLPIGDLCAIGTEILAG